MQSHVHPRELVSAGHATNMRRESAFTCQACWVMELKHESYFIELPGSQAVLVADSPQEDYLKRSLIAVRKSSKRTVSRPWRVDVSGVSADNAPAKSPVRSPSKKSARTVRDRGLTREERRDQTRKRLFVAAAEIVGRHGYAEASIQEITRRAGVAMGTFYNYFGSRQDLLDQLLPTIGEEMFDHIRAALVDVNDEIAREEARFRAFFEFIALRPEFYRILHEAEQFAPEGHRLHMANISAGYNRALQRALGAGAIKGYESHELEVIAYILMAARDYVGMRFCQTRSGVKRLPDEVVRTYMRLLTEGLFNGSPTSRPSTSKKGRSP